MILNQTTPKILQYYPKTGVSPDPSQDPSPDPGQETEVQEEIMVDYNHQRYDQLQDLRARAGQDKANK